MSPQLEETIVTHWQVRKPALASDLQSISTVTTSSPSYSYSSSSSSSSASSSSPLSTSPSDHYNHQQGVRALPRCAVVNFRKDGDNLRWAPRVTHNSSGVAARVHDFADAFSLEEFSSRALPVVWHPKGGSPRLSNAAKSRIHPRATKSTMLDSGDKPQPLPPKSSSQPVESGPRSLSQSQLALLTNASVKNAVMLAKEAHRTPFWSIIAHTTKYQRSKAKGRLQNDPDKRKDNAIKRLGRRRNSNLGTDTKPSTRAEAVESRKSWTPLSQRKAVKSNRSGKATKRAPERSDGKRSSLFQRLLSHLDKRTAKKDTCSELPYGNLVQTDREEFSPNDGASGSDSDDRPVHGENSKGLFKHGRQSDGYSRRRVVSAMSGNLPMRKGARRRELARATTQDDQYVTFITSEC